MSKNSFIKALNKELKTSNIKNAKKIISYYENDINLRKNKGESIQNIIASYGSVDEIVSKNKKILIRVFNKIKKFFESKNFKIQKKKKTFIKKPKIKLNKIKEAVGIKKKNNIMKSIIIYMCIIIFFLNNILFFASLIAYFDGIKYYGLPLTLFGLSVFLLLLIITIDDYYKFNHLNKSLKLSVYVLVITVISFGVGVTINDYYKIDYVKDVLDKYTMSQSTNEVSVYESIKLYNIYFNSFYNNDYNLIIDESLGNKIKVKVNYYECLNDLHYKRNTDALYISLSENPRDLISFYLENIRENKIYDYKELTRYEINIYMSSQTKEKVKIHN